MYDMAIPISVLKKGSTFECESFVRGYHVYMEIWDPFIGECLKCRKERTNEVGKTGVAAVPTNSQCKEIVVGRVPKNISKIVFMFLSLPNCGVDVIVAGKGVSRVAGYGLEVPSSFYFYGPEKAINWMKIKLSRVQDKLKENIKYCLK